MIPVENAATADGRGVKLLMWMFVPIFVDQCGDRDQYVCCRIWPLVPLVMAMQQGKKERGRADNCDRLIPLGTAMISRISCPLSLPRRLLVAMTPQGRCEYCFSLQIAWCMRWMRLVVGAKIASFLEIAPAIAVPRGVRVGSFRDGGTSWWAKWLLCDGGSKTRGSSSRLWQSKYITIVANERSVSLDCAVRF